MIEPVRDEFYWAMMRVLMGNGHSRTRAREIYLELHGAIHELLMAGELHIQGLVTVSVKSSYTHTVNPATGDMSALKKHSFRAGARIRRTLRRDLEDAIE